MRNATFMIAICLGLSGCQGQIDNSQLPGKWTVSDFSADAPALSPSVIEGGRMEAMSSTYELLEGGQFFLLSEYYAEGSSGTWSFNINTKELTLTHSDEEGAAPEKYLVESVNDSKMVWIQEISGIGTLTLTLSRK